MCAFFIRIDYEAGHQNSTNSWLSLICDPITISYLAKKHPKNSSSNDRRAHLVSPSLKAAEYMWVKTKGSKATSALAREIQTNVELLMFSHTVYSEVGG